MEVFQLCETNTVSDRIKIIFPLIRLN